MDVLDTMARLLGRPPAHEVVRHDLGWTPSLRTSKKPPPEDPSQAIADFWSWWAEVVPQLARLDVEPPPDAVLSGLDTHLTGLHRELAWELGPGTEKRHALTVSPDGVSALRSLTAAWKASAPADLPDWEFHDTRQPVPGPAVALELELAGRVVDGAGVEVGVFDDEDGHRLDVWVHHPELARANRRNRWRIAFLLVDAALGEAKVSTWLRTITPSARPLVAVPEIKERVQVCDLDGLRIRVAAREARGDPPPGPLADHPGAYQVDPRARRWLYPHFDTRLRVEVNVAQLEMLEDWIRSRREQAVPAVRQRNGDRLRVDLYTTEGADLTDDIRAAIPGTTASRQRDPGWALAGQ